MEYNRKLLSCFRKTRSFRANFEKLLALVQFNRIHIMTAGEFRLIDVLEGHTKQIKCIDISQISKVVVSVSQDLLIVHSPVKDSHSLSDHVISVGALQWKENWRYELKWPVWNINLSPIGDFFAISGDGIMSVWSRDNPQDFSYSNFVYYSREENKNVLASIIKQKPLGIIIQQQVTNDGRLIICLEQRSKTLKVFYQNKLQDPPKKKDPKNEKPINIVTSRFKKEEKVDTFLAFNPYANLDVVDADNQQRQADVRFQLDELLEYTLPQHRFQIEYFKVLYHDIYECEKRCLPNIILTVTQKNEIFLWQENLMNSEMQFTCAHIFRGYGSTSFFDVSFMDFPPINPKRYVELKSNVSRLFDTSQDKILRLKKEENSFGIYKQNYPETSLDWILILNDSILEIYKVEGLRNFPFKSLQVYVFNRIRMSYNPRDFFGTCKIFSASCRDFNDILSLYIINSSGQMIKIRKDFKEQALGKWKIDKIAIFQRKTIEDVIVHKQLPFVAHLMKNTELYFFIEEHNKNQVIKKPEMKFLGAYSVFHTTKNQDTVNESLRIISAKWVKNLCQMVVHFNNNSLALLSSHTQLRVLSHSKYQEEYLKLWSEKRYQISEKWEKLFEIFFEKSEESEQVVDFEIIGSKIVDSGFNIYLAIFTNFNQYLVYETETTLMSNLKTLSSYKQLYQKFTTDSLLRVLGSFNGYDDQNKSILAVLTEVDPLRQRKALHSEEVHQEQVIEEQDQEDSDDDNDIFAAYTKPAKKQQKPMLKKSTQPVEVKKEEPLKQMIQLKMIYFDDQMMKKKDHHELWKLELPMSFKSKEIKCKTNQSFFGFMIKDGPTEDIFIYLYDLILNKYIGFINISQILNSSGDNMDLIDFVFTNGSAKGTITLYTKDSLYLIAQSPIEGTPGKWSIIKKFDNVVNLDSHSIKISQIYESYLRKQILVINKEHLNIKEKFETQKEQEGIYARKQQIHQIYTNSQKSFALFDPRLLKALYVKGYGSLVLKVLVKLSEALKQSTSMIGDYLDFTLEGIIQEIQDQLTANTSQSTGKKKVETASSIFDDFYGGFGEEEKKDDKKKEDPKQGGQQQLEQAFEEGFKDFVINIRLHGQSKLGLDEEGKAKFIDFIKRYRQTYRKEFFADVLTSILLREQYYNTEDVEIEEEEKVKDVKSNKPFNVADFINQIRSQPISVLSKASLGSLKQWNSLQTCLALHSEMQDVILNELQDRFDFDNHLSYDLMKKLCIPIWLKDSVKLKNLVTTVAKIEYKIAGDDFNKSSRAERTALWYILLDKKDMLVKLYKAEPQYKKVYELLLNDFSQQKWRTTAEKNAMVLMSKKNFTLGCAFFLLANKIKDAINIALDKMQDPILAILIARLFEKENLDDVKKEESWQEKIYLQHFVQRGEQLNDPYLQNIGRWQRKEYVKAVNVFQVDAGKQNNIQHLFKYQMTDFNLFYFSGQVAQVKSYLDEQEMVPLPSQYDYHALDIIKILKKSTMVKRQLQKTWNQGGGGGGASSIFDDFYGDSSSSMQTKKEEEKKEENKLTVEEPKILELVTVDTALKGYSLLSLLVITENYEHIEKTDKKYILIIAKSLIIDVVQSVQFGSIGKLKSSLTLLSEKLDLDIDDLKDLVKTQFKYLDNFSLFINYLIEDNNEGVMNKVEEEALKLMDFVHSLADYPFITDYNADSKRSYQIKKALSYLENLADSYMIVDYQQNEQLKKTPEKMKKLNEIPKLSSANKRVSIVSYADPENEEGNYQLTLDEGKGNLQLKNLDVQSSLLQKELSLTTDEEIPIQNLSTKLRTALIIYISLLYVCYLSKRFSMVKDLVVDLKSIFSNHFTQDGHKLDEINIQKLKTLIQKFKYSLDSQDEEEKDNLVGDQFQVVGASASPPKKKEEDEEKQKNKINQFIILWFRYIMSHFLNQLIRASYEKSQIKNLIDLRPSIIKTRTQNEVIEAVLNPRLMSAELEKKFGNMDRILENVTTYYFENFLNLNERNIIADELLQIKNNKYEVASTAHLDLLSLFSSEKKFTEFASFLDLGSYIKHLKDHELSLVYHTNVDYSLRTIERTQELFQNGIDIFRMKGETVNAFTFDRCDLDLVSLAMLNKGIREIPIQKTLMYRQRQNKGLQFLDEEQLSWHECLHRYDKIAQELGNNVKPSSDSIIAAVNRLYSYKTINYTKKMRRRRGTLFLDYELNPPDLWSGQKASEYQKYRSELDIIHEDYSFAIESHPYLPLYVTGNARGLINLWQYNQNDDRSLDQWITETDQKQVNPKKATIKKIQFNNYGDKIVCSNMEGSILMYQFDTTESSKIQPIYQLKKTKEQKYNDFEILNYDSVLALTSLKPKHIWIFDTLIYQKNGLVMESPIGGNIIQPFRSKSQLFVFNEKPGALSILDLKMNKLLSTIQLHTDEITSVALNESENTLVAGFKDGIIKIFNIEKEFETREQYLAFTPLGAKKGTVSQVKIHPTNGALYAASLTGNFKLFRTKV